MRTKYILAPRPNLFFMGDDAVVDWFMQAFSKHRAARTGTQGPQALLIRDNGTPSRIPATKLEAAEFIYVVGIYNCHATREQVMEDLAFYWIRNLGGRDEVANG